MVNQMFAEGGKRPPDWRMRLMRSTYWLFALAVLSLLGSCKGDKFDASGYPDEIAPIMVEKCATSGCHSAQSAPGAAGLNLETGQTSSREVGEEAR